LIIQNLTLQNFRCFEEKTLSFDGRLVVIEGPNGSGKSSLLEALHYCCYLRSFRTHLHRDLIQLEKKHFFIKVGFHQEQTGTTDSIQIGYSSKEGKVVKCNQKVIQSYKDIASQFRIITLTADDLDLIQGAPELRRDFLNYALLLKNPNLVPLFRDYKKIVTQRNSLLMQQSQTKSFHDELYIWTQKLWEQGKLIRHERIDYLKGLEGRLNNLLSDYFNTEKEQLTVKFEYKAKNCNEDNSFKTFWAQHQIKCLPREHEWRRSLFGVHLDDVSIIFQNKRARVYASRGQQKLLVLLMRVAQLQELSAQGEPGVLLLDDFMTDFDHSRVEKSIAVLKDLQFQMFLSCPISPDAFLKNLSKEDICHIIL